MTRMHRHVGGLLSTLALVSAESVSGGGAAPSPAPPAPETLRFTDDGRIPNSRFPVLLYRAVLPPETEDLAATFETLFRRHGWPAQWRAGVYAIHHYHSTAHETLGVAAGHARLMLGGEHGQEVDVGPGDVVVLPAGTGHRRLRADSEFLVVGAYPEGQQWDMMRGEPSERPAALERIAAVPLPKGDPVSGAKGALVSLWR